MKENISLSAFLDVLDNSCNYVERVTEDTGTHIRSIDARGYSKFSDELIAGMALFPQAFSQLEFILAYGTAITDAGVHHFLRFPELWEVDLSETAITDDACITFGKLTSLQSLSISETIVSDVGLQYLQNLSGLEFLNVEHTHVSDMGVISIQGLPALKTLGLSGCRISNVGCQALTAISSLKQVSLFKTSVSAVAAARLHELRPDLDIGHESGPYQPVYGA